MSSALAMSEQENARAQKLIESFLLIEGSFSWARDESARRDGDDEGEVLTKPEDGFLEKHKKASKTTTSEYVSA